MRFDRYMVEGISGNNQWSLGLFLTKSCHMLQKSWNMVHGSNWLYLCYIYAFLRLNSINSFFECMERAAWTFCLMFCSTEELKSYGFEIFHPNFYFWMNPFCRFSDIWSDLNTSVHTQHRNPLLAQTGSAREQHSGTLSGNSRVDLEAQWIFPSAFPQ